MLVRLLFGRYNGEIQDIAPEAALAMLKDGRAENPFADPPLKDPEPDLGIGGIILPAFPEPVAPAHPEAHAHKPKRVKR